MKVHQLEPKLKALRLGGMLESLEIRLDQAQKGELGYLTFLEMLLEDEIGRRAQKALSRRLVRAHFEEVKTLAEFDFSYNPKVPAATIRDLATCRFIERKESVLIYGPAGTGKSHVAQALGHAACQQEYEVLYTKTPRLFADLGGGHADGTWESRLRRYLHPDLLILDDFGLRELGVQQAEDLYELICGRYQRASTIVVSNRAPQDWYPLFPNPVLAEGALDRLVNSSHHVLMVGKSYRPMRRPDRFQQAGGAGTLPEASPSPPTPPHHPTPLPCDQQIEDQLDRGVVTMVQIG